jgi:hypothetical protein
MSDITALVKNYNKNNPVINHISIENKNNKQLWDDLKEKFFYCEGKNNCIVNSLGTPRRTKPIDNWDVTPNTWLSNFDISNFLQKISTNRIDYIHVGTFTIDFDERKWGVCVGRFMCAFDPTPFINEGKTKMSFVFNTDVYGGRGIHWIAVFCDTNKDISFFNSNGVLRQERVPQSIQRFMNKIQKKLKIKKYIKCKRLQSSNSECGMFCIWYILTRLSGKNHRECMKDNVTDEQMMTMRKKLFDVQSK